MKWCQYKAGREICSRKHLCIYSVRLMLKQSSFRYSATPACSTSTRVGQAKSSSAPGRPTRSHLKKARLLLTDRSYTDQSLRSLPEHSPGGGCASELHVCKNSSAQCRQEGAMSICSSVGGPLGKRWNPECQLQDRIARAASKKQTTVGGPAQSPCENGAHSPTQASENSCCKPSRQDSGNPRRPSLTERRALAAAALSGASV